MKRQTMRLALQDITLDQRLQPRVQIDDERVRDYADRMEAGDKFPPVSVFHDGSAYWLADGFHRFYAARDRRETGIAADVYDGTFHDALEHSVSANATHGMPRTRADVRRAIEALLRDVEWVQRADRWIADAVKCSMNTVKGIREQMEAGDQIDHLEYLLGQDGKLYPRANGRRAPEPEPHPTLFDERDRARETLDDWEWEPDEVRHYDPIRARDEAALTPEDIGAVPLPVIALESEPEQTGPQAPTGGFLLAEWNELTKAEKIVALGIAREPTKRTFNEQSAQDNIEWARWSWNPVTGCKHNCIYCYARDIANRFFPQQFEPTFLPDRLAIPYSQPVPAVSAPGYKNVFTCSMADLWGRWVPQEWIDAVLRAVTDNPQWNFLMLTKFPGRMAEQEWPANAWVGTSVDTQARIPAVEKAFRNVKAGVRWLSCEPLLEPLKFTSLEMFDWVVIGAQTRSTQAPEFQPPWEWVEDLIFQARQAGCRVYLKTNVIGRPREYPDM